MASTYLEWLNESTETRWWHDSANPEEIMLARKRGAKGVTTNPVLTFRTFKNEPEFWEEEVKKVSQDLSPEERAEALLKIVATYAADQVKDIFEETNGAHGYALGQLNPNNAGNAKAMLEQARRIHSWGPNIAIKIPTTNAGIEVMGHLAEECIPICATLNVSVSQAIAVAETYEKGAKIAKANGKTPSLCLVVQQVGRLDDYLREVAQDMKADIAEDEITMAGLAVAKKSYQIFKKRGYSSIIMPGGLRGVYHLTELAGAKMAFTLQNRIQNMVLEADPPRVERIDEPIDPKIMEKLLKISEFTRAYDEDGLAREEYIRFGVIQKLLSQFNETGWAPLEVYGSNNVSSRWF